MRFALALALAGAVAVGATAAYGRGAARGFQPETAAAFGTRDLWVFDGHALLRSADAGKHFVRVGVPRFSAQGTVPTIEFANARDGFMFVWGGSRLYVTHNGGSSWHRAATEGHVNAFALGGGDAYVVAGRVLERSRVGRDAWRKLDVSVRRPPVSLAARGPDVWLLGLPLRRPGFDSMALSSDRGNAFSTRKGPCLSELGGTLVPSADDIVWAVCPSGMMAWLALSKNGGRSFKINSLHDPGGLERPSLTNGGRIAAASARVAVLTRGAGGAFLRTTDAGRHWRSVPRTARIREVFWLAFTTPRVGAAIVQTGPQTEQLWRTTDGGATWHSVPIRQ